MCGKMMRVLFLLCIMTGSTLQGDRIYSREGKEGDGGEDLTIQERSWKMNKKNFGYVIIAVVAKALLLIKLALAKLALLGNISITLSKLSLILSLVLTLGKYFGGISKMLKLKPHGHGGHSSHEYSGHEDHGSYIT